MSDGSSQLLLMLGRLEGKVDAITASLSALDKRADHHEDRIRSIETELGDRDRYKAEFHKVQVELGDTVTKVDRVMTVVNVVVWIIGAIGVSGLGVLAKVFLHLF